MNELEVYTGLNNTSGMIPMANFGGTARERTGVYVLVEASGTSPSEKYPALPPART